MALRQSRFKAETDTPNEEGDSAELSLLDQIKRGVRLKPVQSRRLGRQKSRGEGDRRGRGSNHDDVEDQDEEEGEDQRQERDDKESSVSAILFRVLKERYLAVQQTDDDDSELSSIESSGPGRDTNPVDDLLLVRYSHHQQANCCVLYGPIESSRRGLLERFAELEQANEINTRGLINDLTVRL